jgi:hypothetical protein
MQCFIAAIDRYCPTIEMRLHRQAVEMLVPGNGSCRLWFSIEAVLDEITLPSEDIMSNQRRYFVITSHGEVGPYTMRIFVRR